MTSTGSKLSEVVGDQKQFLDEIMAEVTRATGSIGSISGENFQLGSLLSEMVESSRGLVSQGENFLATTDASTLKTQILHLLELAVTNPATIPLVTVAMFLAGVAGVGYDDSKVGSPYPPGTTSYSVDLADRFYSSRPYFVLRRLLRLASITGNFNLKLLLDWRLGNLEKNEKQRAKEALTLATQLGPTFIKLGQALSIRTDLIPEAYALELRQLQDAVPPFDTTVAKEIIREELGVADLNQVLNNKD
jgi:hypothetical protein